MHCVPASCRLREATDGTPVLPLCGRPLARSLALHHARQRSAAREMAYSRRPGVAASGAVQCATEKEYSGWHLPSFSLRLHSAMCTDEEWPLPGEGAKGAMDGDGYRLENRSKFIPFEPQNPYEETKYWRNQEREYVSLSHIFAFYSRRNGVG
eukprot:2207593-Rhodomonas_salina.2